MRVTAVERALAKSGERGDVPERHHESSMWFQFETMMPVTLSSWALSAGELVNVDLSPYPNVSAWMSRVKALPSWSKINEVHDGFVKSLAGQTFVGLA